MQTPFSFWLAFFAIIIVLLTLDMGVLHRREKEIGVRESLWLSLGYILVSLAFGAWIYLFVDAPSGRNFVTGYVIEKSLSMDNIFIISLVFAHFNIPRRNQHRVLLWGILGVVLLRGVMIGLGAELVQRFHAVLYVFGLCLLYTGAHMMFERRERDEIGKNRLLLWLQKHIRVTKILHGNRFFASEADEAGTLRRRATPLLLTLLFVELADVAFAVDSIPAVFGVTTDPFIVYTSNIFAVLGLRALYFALAAMLARFESVKYALSLILIFIGARIFAPIADIHVSSGVSLGVTLALLAGGVLVSLRKTTPAA